MEADVRFLRVGVIGEVIRVWVGCRNSGDAG